MHLLNSPFFDRCTSPVTIFRDGKLQKFPCGKCSACRVSRANDWSFRLADEIAFSQFSLWFTLTYDNKYVPKLYWTPDLLGGSWSSDNDLNIRFDSVKDVRREDNIVIPGYPRTYPISHFNHSDADNYVTYLSKRDIQLYIKILRKKVYERFKDKFSEANTFRYFVCGEYGPRTYRAHFHMLFFFQDEETCEFVRSILYENWQMCDRQFLEDYIRLSDGDVSQYVTQYVNSVTSLPGLFQEAQIAPFHLQSKNPAIGYGSFDREEVYEQIYIGDFERPVRFTKPGVQNVFQYPKSYISRLFPKCFEYSKKLSGQLLYIYGLLYRSSRNEKHELFQVSFGLHGNAVTHERLSFEEVRGYLRQTLKDADYLSAVRCFEWCTSSLHPVPPCEYLFLLDRAYYLSDMRLLKFWYLWQEEQARSGYMLDILHSYDNIVLLLTKRASLSYGQQFWLDLNLANFGLTYPYDYDKILSYFKKSSCFDDYMKHCDHVLFSMDKSKKFNNLIMEI